VQNAENKRVTNKHKTSANEEKIGQEYSAARYVLEDCRAGIIGYVTIHLSTVKVNNGTLNAAGVFKKALPTMPDCDYRQTVTEAFMTRETLLM